MQKNPPTRSFMVQQKYGDHVSSDLFAAVFSRWTANGEIWHLHNFQSSRNCCLAPTELLVPIDGHATKCVLTHLMATFPKSSVTYEYSLAL